MCGIAGLFSSQNAVLSVEQLRGQATAMTDAIRHRGPDGSGVWVDPERRACLGHRRLSIIDVTSAGSQPFFSRDERYALTYNGEIYNFLEIREELERAGVQFKSRSDTEVLIEGLAFWGPSAISRFDGMFAFALFDRKTGELTIARDPFGEKPLYYTTLNNGTFAFASELRALEVLPGFDNTVDPDAIAEYFAFQYIGAPRTIYKSVFKLLPGHYGIKSASGTLETTRYFAFEPRYNPKPDRSIADMADELEEILVESLRRRLIADVPLGAFLSGGVDSSIVCALATQRLGTELHTYSMGFQDSPSSEHEVARAFASHLGTRHHEQIVRPDMAEFITSASNVIDEPNGDTSCMPTYMLSQFTRKDVTVAVSGDGGDEMFGGYGRYIATMAEHEYGLREDLPLWRPGNIYYGPRILPMPLERLTDFFGQVPPAVRAHVTKLRDELNEAGPALLAAMRRTDVNNYLPGAVLPKVDVMSMQHALEVRTPFLNVDVARFAEGLSDIHMINLGKGKRVLREVAYRYLPRHLIDMPKRGFGLPMGLWGQDHMVSLMKDKLGADSVLRSFLGDQVISQFLKRHDSSSGFNLYEIWPVLILEQWLRGRSIKLPQYQAQSRPKTSSKLYGFAIAEKTYLVTLGSDLKELECESGLPWPMDLDPICGKLYDRKFGVASSGPAFALSAWGKSVENSAALTSLTDSTLVFIDADAAHHLDTEELQKLTSLGVHRVICCHRVPGRQPEDITLNKFSFTQKIRRRFALKRDAVATFSADAKRVGTRVAPMARVGGYLFHSGPFKGIVREPGEITSKYAIFENGRQLSPVQMGQDEIRVDGAGRNCVIDQIVCLSGTRENPDGQALYTIVPVKAGNRDLLNYIRTPDDDDMRVHAPNVTPLDLFYKKLLSQLPPMRPKTPLAPGSKVALVTHALPSGGAERQWTYLAQTLKEEGYDVTVVTYSPLHDGNDHYLDLLGKFGIEVVDTASMHVVPEIIYLRRRFGNDFPNIEGLARLSVAFRTLQPDAVISQLDEGNILSATAGLLNAVPHIGISFRNYNPTHFEYFHQDWFWTAYKALLKTGRVVATGNFSEANIDYADWLKIDARDIATITNAIDEQIFPPASEQDVSKLRSALNINTSDQVVLGVFRLSEEKNPLTFVKVCEKIANDNPNALFLHAGTGRMAGTVKEYVESHGLSERFRFLGVRKDINVLMQMSTILLHTADFEGTPNVVLESGFTGIPVVATDAGATRDIVLEGKTGYVRPKGDVEGLAEASIRLLRDGDLRDAMGAAAKSHVRENFSRKHSMDVIIAAMNASLTRNEAASSATN